MPAENAENFGEPKALDCPKPPFALDGAGR
jgi:hypothetical protein